ncbi:Bet v I domain-containing protein, partial [Cynara cardunculus var. scolymus]
MEGDGDRYRENGNHGFTRYREGSRVARWRWPPWNHLGLQISPRYQREKIVEFDESRHQIALEILEGGHLDHGFSSYTTGFMLTAVGEAETLIDIQVLYETKPEHIHVPGETIKATFHYIKCLENHLSIGGAPQELVTVTGFIVRPPEVISVVILKETGVNHLDLLTILIENPNLLSPVWHIGSSRAMLYKLNRRIKH